MNTLRFILAALVALAGLGCPAQAKPLTAAAVVKWHQDRARALALAKGNQPLVHVRFGNGNGRTIQSFAKLLLHQPE